MKYLPRLAVLQRQRTTRPQLQARRLALALLLNLIALMAYPSGVGAVPSFARKYATDCMTCHTAFPALSSFGEAFRRNGYRYPTDGEGLDSDSVADDTLPLGQDEHKEQFPNAVWPGWVTDDVPFGAVVAGQVDYSIPGSEEEDATGTAFTWKGVMNQFRLYGAGSFSDSLTYLAKLHLPDGGVPALAAAFLSWNDVVGPEHLVNLRAGRLAGPQLTSFGARSTYVTDLRYPPVSVAGLYNPNAAFILGSSPADGAELSGVGWHRFAYSVGWLASYSGPGARTLRAEDYYVHIGTKLGGVSLDGEEYGDPAIIRSRRLTSELSLGIDSFAYRGLLGVDNGTSVSGNTTQRSAFLAAGYAMRVQVCSVILDGLYQYQIHHRPYLGSEPARASPPERLNAIPGVVDNTRGRAHIVSGEGVLVLYPWLYPAVHVEYTRLVSEYNKASLLRILPGVTLLLRQNVRLGIYGELERANDLPPARAGTTSSWKPASGDTAPERGKRSKLGLHQVQVSFAWGM